MANIIRSRSGYEYRYRFSTDDDHQIIISSYRKSLITGVCRTQFLFEIRTNFILKLRLDQGVDDDDQIIASERFAAIVTIDQDENWLKPQIGYRLNEYWISDDDIQTLIHQAFDFAKRTAAIGSDIRRAVVIPVVVGLDVCTVRLENETVEAARDRSIRPDRLIPLFLCRSGLIEANDDQAWEMDWFFMDFLRELPKTRVEDVDKRLAMMEACPICLCAPTMEAQITLLPCAHAFHNHCVIRWLLTNKSESCPLCRFELVIERERRRDCCFGGDLVEFKRLLLQNLAMGV